MISLYLFLHTHIPTFHIFNYSDILCVPQERKRNLAAMQGIVLSTLYSLLLNVSVTHLGSPLDE